MSDYPMLISNKLHSFRNFKRQKYEYLLFGEHYSEKMCNFASSYFNLFKKRNI